MRIVAYRTQLNSSKLYIEESTGEGHESADPDVLLSFLLEPYDNAIKVCWSLDETVAPLLRFLGKENCRKLHTNGRLNISPYNLFYVPEKVFSVRHNPTKVQCNLYGLEQYFPDIVPPESVEQLSYLGTYLLEELHKMGMEPTKLTSPIGIYDQCVMQNAKYSLPTMDDMPKQAAEYAYKCSGKLWIEAYQLGFWESCYDYDLRSAFPTVAKDMLDFRYGKWERLSGNWVKSVYGYFKCFLDMTSDINPIIHVNDKGESSTPVGKRDCYLTKQEIEFIEQYKLGIVQVLDGWVFVPSKQVKPLEMPLETLLSYRGKSKLQDLLAKRMSVGLYGRFGQELLREAKLGPYFNPCWFAEISSQVRLQVAEYIYSHKLEDSLIHVSVDGCLAELEAPVGKEWKCEQVPTLVYSSGLVYSGAKKPHGLTLANVLTLIEQHPGKSYYEKVLSRVVTLPDAIERDKMEELGTVQPHYTSLDLHRVSHDRDFSKLPKSGKQLLVNHYKSKARRIQ